MRGRAAVHLLAHRPAVSAQGRGRRRWSTASALLGHGGHVLSGMQTPEGRQRIANATRRRMLSFWEAWRKAGKPPLPWRESLRTAHAKPKPPTLAEWRAEKPPFRISTVNRADPCRKFFTSAFRSAVQTRSLLATAAASALVLALVVA